MSEQTDVPKELVAMERMTAGQLRARYYELFGEESRSCNRQWLFRRCAWRLQSLAEGGLSERAQRRARELVRDVDSRKLWPTTREQRCWVHKTANVLDKLPKSIQPKAKAMLHEIWQAATKADAETAFDRFVATFEAKYPKAVECLVKDREVLLTFYGFPAEHWRHLRTTNPIESTFATVRLRHRRTKGSGSRTACLTMVFKLALAAERRWRRLNGSTLLPAVIQGVRFVDGIRELAA